MKEKKLSPQFSCLLLLPLPFTAISGKEKITEKLLDRARDYKEPITSYLYLPSPSHFNLSVYTHTNTKICYDEYIYIYIYKQTKEKEEVMFA